jgi:hypothetical protein
MFIAKQLTFHVTEEATKRFLKEQRWCYDYGELIEVPLPEGKTFEEVEQWHLTDGGVLRYKLKGEDWSEFKP